MARHLTSTSYIPGHILMPCKDKVLKCQLCLCGPLMCTNWSLFKKMQFPASSMILHSCISNIILVLFKKCSFQPVPLFYIPVYQTSFWFSLSYFVYFISDINNMQDSRKSDVALIGLRVCSPFKVHIFNSWHGSKLPPVSWVLPSPFFLPSTLQWFPHSTLCVYCRKLNKPALGWQSKGLIPQLATEHNPQPILLKFHLCNQYP